MNKTDLSSCIDDYLKHRQAAGKAAATQRQDKRVLKKLLAQTGNIYIRNVNDRHVDAYMSAAVQQAPRSLNVDYAVLNGFFRWARRTRRAPRDHDPMALMDPPRQQKVTKRRVPTAKFPALLDAAPHPRDRIVVALGLYLLLRASEMRTLRIKDVNLDDGVIYVTVWKTKDADDMPISAELDRELRAWLTWYTVTVGGALDPEWYLVPGFGAVGTPGADGLFVGTRRALIPTKPHGKIERSVQLALQRIGVSLRDANGESLREGVHTLRRSGARALFDKWRAEGHDLVGRDVQATLHHSTLAMTERYIGITADRQRRDEKLRGKIMYDTGGGNVRQLRVADGSG